MFAMNSARAEPLPTRLECKIDHLSYDNNTRQGAVDAARFIITTRLDENGKLASLSVKHLAPNGQSIERMDQFAVDPPQYDPAKAALAWVGVKKNKDRPSSMRGILMFRNGLWQYGEKQGYADLSRCY
jgi:hypothetical protein